MLPSQIGNLVPDPSFPPSYNMGLFKTHSIPKRFFKKKIFPQGRLCGFNEKKTESGFTINYFRITLHTIYSVELKVSYADRSGRVWCSILISLTQITSSLSLMLQFRIILYNIRCPKRTTTKAQILKGLELIII